MKLYVKNTISGLVPIYDSDYEEKKKLKLNKEYLVEIKLPRNILFHKKYFALLNLAFENQNVYIQFENFRKEVIKYAGYYDEYLTFNGKIEYRAKSISFASMNNDEFELLYSSSLTVILKHVLKETTKEEILNEVVNFM